MQGMYEMFRDHLKYPSFWIEKDKNPSYPLHFHSSIEFLYITDGSWKAVIDGKTYLADKDEIFIASSYSTHYYHAEKESRSIMLIVPLDFIPAYSTVLFKKVFSQCVCKDKRVNKEILHCLQQLLSYKECTERTEIIIKGYIYAMIGMIINSVGLTDIDDKGTSLSKDILIYLQNNYLAPVSLDILAHDFGYSKYRFSHIFSTCFGCGLTEYVNTLRVRHAASLLVTSESSLIDIAMNSGFESIRTFYRCFKHCFGVTPSNYRANYIATQQNEAGVQ
ncbi:MAG TPA: AraC family transcriptional regulator [Oscillospiraceae bacterium]|nr:AraC family transcriptional regulator [Oscillospiraceae bacterium]